MKNIESHFGIHTRFRNGIFLLSLILLVLSLAYYYYCSESQEESKDFVELTRFQHQIDSLKNLDKEKRQAITLRSFNPNFISDYKGYVLGLSLEELDRLHTFRSKGQWINSISEFKKVTQVSDSVLAIISPLFEFPDWVKRERSVPVTKSDVIKRKTVPTGPKKDLNTVTSKQLQYDVNIPDFIADRIVRYRNSIGGFVHDIQLKDVKGVYTNQRNEILSLYTVLKPKLITPVSINTASVKELVDIPYFDFETALDIRDFIKKNGTISDFQELEQINGFSFEKIDRIKLYLTLD